MGIGRRIKEARTRKKLTQEELAKMLGVTKGAVANYENETSHPKEPVMYALFEALEVDPNYIFQDCVNIKGMQKTPPITGEAMKLAQDYDTLDTWGQHQVRTVADNELDRCQSLQNAAEATPPLDNIIYIRQSWQSSSAGTGTFLGPDSFKTVKVLDTPLTRRASFAVPVSGNSMEPRFYDGDVLLVEAMSDVPVGEIGIFTIDGEGYVKQRGEDALISLNPDYPPVPLTEDSRCNGKVIGVLEPEWVVEQ